MAFGGVSQLLKDQSQACFVKFEEFTELNYSNSLVLNLLATSRSAS